MKYLKNILATLVIAFLLTSCSDDDNNVLTNVTGSGNLSVEFDNSYNGNDLILNASNGANSNGEVLKISSAKYIVSNIVLTNENGTTYTYPKNSSYFIVDESNASSLYLDLNSIPAGNYTKIKFGIGVDQTQWSLGADGQGDFLAQAQEADLMWSWSAGYKFLAVEGAFTAPTVPSETIFMVHTGKTGTDDNYTEITLNLPTKALVRATITPEIHIVADLSKIVDGGNKIKLADHNADGLGAMIMGGETLPLITQNLNGMFVVGHVHND
jgi:hypothetical protein